MVDVKRTGTEPGKGAGTATTRLLRELSFWWLGLLAALSVVGELVVNAGHGLVLRAVDIPVDADLQPARPPLHKVAAVVTWLGAQPVVLVLLALLTVALYRVRKHLAAELVLIVVGADALTTVGKLVIQRAGPAQRLSSGLHDYSFPSGHSTAAAALLIGAALLFPSAGKASGRARRPLIGLAGVVAVAVAFSRLVLDVHWFTDVCAGLAVGTTWAVVVVRYWPTAVAPHAGLRVGPPGQRFARLTRAHPPARVRLGPPGQRFARHIRVAVH